MFSSKQQLQKKTGPDGIDRYAFLKQLVNEFYKTQSREAKRQVLANLANFAYDPINYEPIRQLHIIDVFLEQLSQTDEDLLNFALGGICNLINDLENQSYVINLNGIYLIAQYINHTNSEIATNSLGTLNLILSAENYNLFTHLLHPTIEDLQTTRTAMFVIRRRSFVNFRNVVLDYSTKSTTATLVRTITADDVISFARLSGDTNPVHFSTESKPIVHGAFLNSLVSALLGTQMPGPGSIVAEQTLRFPDKCYVGDTVSVHAELVQDRKIMKVMFSCVVEDGKNGKIVLEGDAKLTWKK